MPVKKSSSAMPSPNLNAPPVPHLLSSQHQFNSSPAPGVTSPSVKSSPSLPSITRSASPSGLTNFFSRPTKWFTRSSSSSSRASPIDGAHHPGAGGVGGRTSSSSTSSKRRPTISGPTDPRPIESIVSPGLDAKLTGKGMGGLVGLNDRASRSVLDLSSRASTDLVGASASSPGGIGTVTPTGSNGTGDLRGIARKGWSRSVDNLQIIPPSKLTVNTANWETRVEQYRTGTPTTPASLGSVNTSLSQRESQNQNQKIYPFPTMPGSPGTPSTPPTDGPLYTQYYQQQQLPIQRQLRHTHSNSGSSSSMGMPTPIGPGPGSSPTPSHSPIARLAPPPMASPQKAGRKRSFDFERPKASKSLDAGISLSSSGGGRSGSGIPFFSEHSERKNSTPTSVPPTIVEPGSEKQATEEEEEGGNKRASQIVHRSGFVLRLPNFNPSSTTSALLAANKNWKPFKMVSRGAKLYFYKPPSDRGGAIKELFPTRLVTLEEEAEEEEGQEDDLSVGTGKQDVQTGRSGNRGDEARKRRAFWGRRTHPDLIVVREQGQRRRVVRGTLEALVHESVFGTTLHSESRRNDNEADADEDAWKEFASSVLFFLPYLVADRAKFEHELVRCTSFFVNGAEESERAEAKRRVGWLLERYVAYHAPDVGEETWRAFVREVIGSSESSSAIASGEEQKALVEGSPDLNTFSPRPGDTDRMPSLASSMHLGTPGTGPSSSPSPSPSPAHSSPHSGSGSGNPTMSSSTSRVRLRSLLSATGFTREVFFRLDPDTVARSLMLYQKGVFDSASISASVNANASGVGVSLNTDLLLAESPTNPLVEFFGCDELPHWLTRTVITQILGPGHSPLAKSGTTLRDFGAGTADEDASLPSPGGHAHAHAAQPMTSSSRTHVRAKVISHWAHVAEMNRLAGDECTYQAIFAALSSKPIARLEKAWRRVDSTALNIIRNWVYTATTSPPTSVYKNGNGNEEEGTRTGSRDTPRVSPWGGDARYRAMKLLEKMRAEQEKETERRGSASDEWNVEGMYEARRLFDDFVTSLDECRASRSMSQSRPREPSDDEDVRLLVQHWQEFSKKPPPMKNHRINQFMSLSFAAEPKKKGFFSPYYWTRHAAPLHGPQVLTPLLVPELLPTISLIDRSQFCRTKKLSYESNAVLGDSQVARPTELMYTIEPDGKIRAGGGARGSGAFDLGGMILPVFEGELLLCVVSNLEPGASSSSRPGTAATESTCTTPSRQPSIRVKSAAAGLDRKNSRVKRASLPVLSQRDRDRNSGPPAVVVIEPNGESSLHAVIQAGTLDALVHFLIHGLEGVSVSVADDNGEMALHDKKTRTVKVDRAEFARVWWPTFRSFVTPYVLFQLLRKDFLSSPSRGSVESTEGSVQAIQARLVVIKVIAEWIHAGGGAQDALDDVELHAAMHSFLASQNGEHDLSKLASNLNLNAHQSPSPSCRSEQLASLLKAYEEERLALFNAFRAQTMRPLLRSVPVRGQGSEDAVHNFGIRPPKLEEITPSELVDNLDAMASAAFRNVNQEDLYVTADLLEVQTSDRTGWFLTREPSNVTDEVEVQSLYTYLMEVEPTPLVGEYPGETLYRLLPPGIRTLLRAFVILRKWAVCCLAASQLGIKTRQARMEMFLQAIEMARMRSAQAQTPVPFEPNPVLQPRVRTFVEAILTSAIVGPESRAFMRAWQNVAAARGVQFESVASLLTTRTVDSPTKKDKLTVDPVWLLERILEVISLSDVLDSPMDMEAPLSLVNFDKRRQLRNIITNTSSYVSRGNRQRREMDRMDFERLNRIEQEFGDVIFDLRMLRDEAQREAASLGAPATPSKKSAPRPFHKVVAMQQEKIKRDRYLRERLMKEKRHEQQRLERKEDDLNRAMDTRSQSQSGNNPKHMRGKKSMSALFSLMRPISTAFTSESAITPKRSAAELDFTPSNKPALVLSLVDARVTPFINNDRSFTFQIDTEDGGHYLLQALSKNDMSQWMQTINTSIKSHAQRRLTYMGNSSPIQVTDQVQPRPATASRDPRAVFGVDLTFLVRREAGGEEPAPDAVPFVLELCLKKIEERGLTEQGIYRVAGATSEVNALREALNNGLEHIDPHIDINSVCGVVKYWFRNLPETVIPETYFDPILGAARIPDLDERLRRIREIVQTFPRAHFSVLKRLAEHMDRVVDYEEQNHMTPDNLAVVICPNLVRAPNNNFGLIMTNMGAMTVLFKALITHMHTIFDEEAAEEAEENEEYGDVEDVVEDDDEKAPIDTQSLLVPEPDLGPRFIASPEPEELLREVGSSPD